MFLELDSLDGVSLDGGSSEQATIVGQAKRAEQGEETILEGYPRPCFRSQVKEMVTEGICGALHSLSCAPGSPETER